MVVPCIGHADAVGKVRESFQRSHAKNHTIFTCEGKAAKFRLTEAELFALRLTELLEFLFSFAVIQSFTFPFFLC